MSRTHRVVIDTNVLVSAALIAGSVPRQAVERAVSSGVFLLSSALSVEYSEVLRRPRLNKRCPEEDRLAFLASLIESADLVEPTEAIQVCRDPKDDMVLEVAVAGDATCIISGDDDLLALNPFRDIPILTPRQFLDQTAEQPSQDPGPPPVEGV
jgi:putative PIN family toxin of toxin-antitoxin system